MGRQSAEFGLDENDLALLLGELDHRIRHLLTMIEAAVKQTHSTSAEDYRAKLIARITGLYSFCEFTSRYGCRIGLAQLLERAICPYSANSAQVLAAGPDVELEPPLSLALHLVFHELAANANKYGALSSPLGCVEIEWKIRHVPGAPRKLAIAWTEHDGPEVKHPQHFGFGSRLIKTVLDGYGGVRLDLNSTGLACFMLVDLDRADARIKETARTSRKCAANRSLDTPVEYLLPPRKRSLVRGGGDADKSNRTDGYHPPNSAAPSVLVAFGDEDASTALVVLCGAASLFSEDAE